MSANSATGVIGIERARAVVRQMVSPGGCPWHAEQTHTSLLKYLIEETAEVVEAIEAGESAEIVAEELGDVLYQVLFHTEIAAQAGEGYNLDSVGEALAAKLIARHPHVFSDRGYMSSEELKTEWENLKRDATAHRAVRGVFDGIPSAMPTLAKAAKMMNRIAHHQDAAVRRSLTAFLTAAEADTTDKKQASNTTGKEQAINERDFGKELLRLVQEANADGVDPDAALRQTLRELTERVAR
ncbi:MazG nucleotide pyrophosphohydrolase domain-containing protein [Canibacter zhoujuaniae]|uniref:MazG nucleotide pyrophosphohydrolase domain-containing protein n=1 Tax=Canibacter zhoujuaniae TaxID=2708343 RepID=UPI001FBA5147|nr:MazG nucleotide pyrophosphohydrolase domain-containing protein [Canibacter zhoujuaniae]